MTAPRPRAARRRPAAGVLLLAAAIACRGGSATPSRAESAATDTGGGATRAPLAMAPRGPEGAPAARFPRPSRPVSDIVAPRWSSEESRDDAGEAQLVLDVLQVGPGTHVADVGAGDGYYTVRAAERVGATGHVWAEDIEEDYLRLLQRRLRASPRANVTLTLGQPHDPQLPRDAVDVALLIHMYHEIEQPFALLYNLWPSLRHGARVGILDTTRPTNQHGTPPALLRCELAAMGYRQLEFRSTAPDEYLAVFAAPATEAELTAPERVAGRLEALGCDRIARTASAGTP